MFDPFGRLVDEVFKMLLPYILLAVAAILSFGCCVGGIIGLFLGK